MRWSLLDHLSFSHSHTLNSIECGNVGNVGMRWSLLDHLSFSHSHTLNSIECGNVGNVGMLPFRGCCRCGGLICPPPRATTRPRRVGARHAMPLHSVRLVRRRLSRLSMS